MSAETIRKSLISTAFVSLTALAVFTVASFTWIRDGAIGQDASSTSPEGATSAAKSFTLVYNINNAGYVDVCGCKHKEVRQGSLTRRAAFLKQLRATGRKILLLDGGSAFYPINKVLKPTEKKEAFRKAEVIAESYNLIGYDAMAVGPYDLLNGLDNLKKLEEKIKFPLLSANLVGKDGKLHFRPNVVFERGGLKIGVFGLTLDTIPTPRLEAWAPGSKITDPVVAARQQYEELRPKVDLIIALSHLREDSNFKLMKQLSGLEVLVDPYIQFGTHKTWLKEEDPWTAERDGTLFLRSDGQGARLGIVDIELSKSGDPLVSGDRFDELLDLVAYDEATPDQKKELGTLQGKNYYRFTRLSLEPHHLTDPGIDALIDAWKKNLALSSVEVSSTPLPHKDKYQTHKKCQSCHEKQYAFWKATSHSHALETLRKTGDHQRYDCIGCHSLGYGQAFVDTTKPGDYADVQCESCHGLAPGHIEDPKKAPFGRITRNACIVCHNKEQTRTEFPYIRAKRKVACPKG